MATEQKLARAGVAVALALLTGIGWLSYRSSAEQAEAAERVAHTHEVIGALQRVIVGINEAESSLRGFAIMRDARFLADFEEGIETSKAGLVAALKLTQDSAAQQRRIRAAITSVEERVQLLRSRRTALEQGAPARVPEEAIRLSALIRGLVAEAISNEQDLLRERDRVAKERALGAQRNVLLGLLASIALLASAWLLIDLEMRQRQRAEQTRLRELRLLLELGELLQACRSPAEAFDVIKRLGPQFFPELSGAVSVFLSSRNAVELRTSWGKGAGEASQLFEPDQCWALRRGQVHVLGGGEHGIVCQHWPEPPRAALCLPLIANGELLGALHLVGDALPSETRERSTVFGEQVALAVANLQLREKLRNQSIRDPLTGLYNRRYAEETLQRELARAARESTVLAVLALDVDHFKRLNDSYGHEAGDEVLRQIAALLQQQTRGGDVVSRMGGEELLVLMPNSGGDAAVAKAESLRGKIASLPIRALGKAVEGVTVSIGVATFPTHGTSADELTRAADLALYRAKHAGRNRVEIAE